MPVSIRRQLLITFSGLDGSGKSTQIENLRLYLRERGLTVMVLAFWDNVVVLSRFREAFVHKVYGSEHGVGSAGHPVHRRDKNVRKWYLNVARCGLYLLDALSLAMVIANARRSQADVLIMDRYIYDELANLPPSVTKAWVRIIRYLAPCPDIAYLLDADPELARARKPEYPLDFLHISRRAYLNLAHVLGRMTIISPLPLPQATFEVEKALALLLRMEKQPAASQVHETDPA